MTLPAKHCPHNQQLSCSDCRLSKICLPLALLDDDIVKLDEIVKQGRPLQKKVHLYREGDTFRSVYAVRTGCFKTYRIVGDGEEQVTGFYFPGEILGIDGLSRDAYANSAIALETSAVCEIPFDHLEQLSSEFRSLQRHLFQLMGQEIIEDQQLITLLSKKSSEQRVASFLVSTSVRNVRRKLSATCFRLPMSRSDIGSLLGLTIETVSRVFSRFSKQGVIGVDNREIKILDLPTLKTIADV